MENEKRINTDFNREYSNRDYETSVPTGAKLRDEKYKMKMWLHRGYELDWGYVTEVVEDMYD